MGFDTKGTDLRVNASGDSSHVENDGVTSPWSEPCTDRLDPLTLALYTLEEGGGPATMDLTGIHQGSIVGTGIQRVPGIPGCGQALQFPHTGTDFATIPNHPDWQRTSGSVDLWVRFDTPFQGEHYQGILSRDAAGTTKAGHFSIQRVCNGAITARVQAAGVSHEVCSDPVAEGEWHRVGVNFGPPGLELYVDGQLAAPSSQIICGKMVIDCGGQTREGIDGNDNPWVIGASARTSGEGLATPVDNPLGGLVDSLRISSARRAHGQ